MTDPTVEALRLKLRLLDDEHRILAGRMAKAALALERWSEERSRVLAKLESAEAAAPYDPELTFEPYPVNETPFWVSDMQGREQKRSDSRRERRLKRDRSDREALKLLRELLGDEGLDGVVLLSPPNGRPSKEEQAQRSRLGRVFANAKAAGVTPTQLAKLSNRSVTAVANLLAEAKVGNLENL